MDYFNLAEPSVFGRILASEQFPFVFDNVKLYLNDRLIAIGSGVIESIYSNLIFEITSRQILQPSELIDTEHNNTFFQILINDVYLTHGGERKRFSIICDKCIICSSDSSTSDTGVKLEIIPIRSENGEFLRVQYAESVRKGSMI